MHGKIWKERTENKTKRKRNATFDKSINRKVYWKDHDENLDGEIDQRDKPIYERIDRPLVLE